MTILESLYPLACWFIAAAILLWLGAKCEAARINRLWREWNDEHRPGLAPDGRDNLGVKPDHSAVNRIRGFFGFGRVGK